MNTINAKADKLYFTSDCHFFHENIIKYCERPFDGIWDMMAQMITEWNKIVPKDAVVINCGDIAMKASKQQIRRVLEQLNGIHYLVQGNHDRLNSIPTDCFVSIQDTLTIFVTGDDEIKEQIIFASHFPHIHWPGSHRGTWHVYGHIHSTPNQKRQDELKYSPNQYDVGMDNNNFKPISFNELKTIITKQNLYKK